jgi:hypothetical protein
MSSHSILISFDPLLLGLGGPSTGDTVSVTSWRAAPCTLHLELFLEYTWSLITRPRDGCGPYQAWKLLQSRSTFLWFGRSNPWPQHAKHTLYHWDIAPSW